METTGKKKSKEMNAFVNNAKKVSISSLNAKISREIFSEIKETAEKEQSRETSLEMLSDKEKSFRRYEELLLKDTVTKIQFDACDNEGNFTMYDNGILVQLPGTSVAEVQGKVDVYTTSNMLGIELALKIVRVDREKSKVYCEIPVSTMAQARDSVKYTIQRELNALVKDGKTPVVWGKIIQVDAKRALVDILGQGILGMIGVSHWQQCYTRSLLGMCKPGEFYQFEVLKKAPKKKDKDTAWVLSRRNLTTNAWDEIDYDSLQEGGNLLVKCIEKPDGKPYWWGVSDRTPGIELMGDFTAKYNPSSGTLLEGITYKCKIKEIVKASEHSGNRFSVIPFGVAQEDMAKVGAVLKLRGVKED